MRSTRSLFFLMLVLLTALPMLKAQDQSEPQIQWGGFGIQGSGSFGYRFTDVKGYEPMYEELLNLKNGPRLMDFSLFGHNDGTNPFANNFSMTMSGMGGDPYPSAQFNISKPKLYDLRVNWRQSYFYWNQNDNVLLPTRPGTAGLTDNHDWANVRKIGSIDFTLHATNNLRFNFQYYKTSFSGATFTTFSPLFFGSELFGAYARANAYYMYSPIYDNTNRIVGGIDYTWRNWNFHYNVGYQIFTDNMTFNNVTSPQRAIDTTTPATASQQLLNASWSDYRRLTTPVSEFSYTGKPYKWLQARGSYIFYRYEGPATFDQSYSGFSPAPYSVSQTARGTVSEPNNIAEQGFTFNITPWWDIDLDYRYSRFTTTTEGQFSGLLNLTNTTTGVITAQPIGPGEAANDWKDGLHQLEFSMTFTPVSNLVIRPGVQLLKADVEVLEDGEADSARTLRTKTISPILSAFYRPSKYFDVRGEVHTYNQGSSYTALTPHTSTSGRVVGNLHLGGKLTLSDEVYIVNQQLLATSFHSKVHSNSTMLTYTINPKYSLFAGFTYDDEFASGIIAYERGAVAGAPFALRDQALNRIWQAGLAAEPVKYFGIRFTGNFDRTTGLGQEAGINPVYGPLTWPLGTGTVYFNIPKAGTISVDLQRSYYIQQIFTANNFSANLLAVRWTRDF